MRTNLERSLTVFSRVRALRPVNCSPPSSSRRVPFSKTRSVYSPPLPLPPLSPWSPSAGASGGTTSISSSAAGLTAESCTPGAPGLSALGSISDGLPRPLALSPSVVGMRQM
jgi:hypothetical protein